MSYAKNELRSALMETLVKATEDNAANNKAGDPKVAASIAIGYLVENHLSLETRTYYDLEGIDVAQLPFITEGFENANIDTSSEDPIEILRLTAKEYERAVDDMDPLCNEEALRASVAFNNIIKEITTV
jgi:hypothetical protein